VATARRALKGRDAGAPAAVLLKEYSEASGLVGHSHKMIELYKQIALVAAARSTVLITGESGTGKPGNDATAVVEFGSRETGDRPRRRSASEHQATGATTSAGWGAIPRATAGGRTDCVGSAAPGNRGGCAGKTEPPARAQALTGGETERDEG